MKNHRSGHILVTAGLALAMGLLGTCSSNASGDKSGANASSTVKSVEDATLIFIQYMRDKGFDVPDTGLTVDNLNDTPDVFNNAINECQQKVGPALGKENDLTRDPATQEQLVRDAECLRSLGYDVVDPEVGKGLNVRDIPSDALQKCFNNRGT